MSRYPWFALCWVFFLANVVCIGPALGGDDGQRAEATGFLSSPPPPDLISKDERAGGLRLLGARWHNAGADGVPVSVQLVVVDAQLVDAELVAYLTAAGQPVPSAATTLTVGAGAQNTVLSLVIPRPPQADPRRTYALHLTATYHVRDPQTPSPSVQPRVSKLTAAEPVTFGPPVPACAPVLHPQARDHNRGSCPLLFSAKTSELDDPRNHRHANHNQRLLQQTKRIIQKLCRQRRLLAVTISGWASVTFSDAPTNEQLARRRAEGVRQKLEHELKSADACGEPQPGGSLANVLFIDPLAGRATATFGHDPQRNQCVQLSVHACHR